MVLIYIHVGLAEHLIEYRCIVKTASMQQGDAFTLAIPALSIVTHRKARGKEGTVIQKTMVLVLQQDIRMQ